MHLQKSITTRFVATLLVILVLGQGLGAFLYLKYTRSNLMDSLHGRMKRTVEQVSQVTAEPIINYNFALLDSYLTELLQDRDITSIKLVDKTGHVIREKKSTSQGKESFTVKKPIIMYDERIGEATLQYSTTTIDESTRKNMLIIPFYQGVMAIVVALVLIRLFNSYIKKPVVEINKALTEITSGDLTVSIPLLKDDEIGSIGKGVTFLVERLRATVSRINSISADVTTATLQLNLTFDKVVKVVNSQQASTEEVSMAVYEATEAQKQIISATEKLLTLSNDNASALLEMSATSEEIAVTTDNLNKNIHNSYSTLSELTQSARQVALMSNQVAETVEEASASVEEIYRSVKQVETIVKESTKLSHHTTKTISEKGIDTVADATESMKSIESFIEALTSTIGRLDNRSKDIEKILAVIVDVTEKTRLLSFNAQIIAAQAGEYGKGFAVVANQMKELSDRTALSTKEIENIVTAIQHEITEVVNETRETVKVVRDGTEIVSKTGNVLNEILQASEKASELTKSIERASFEQTKGLELVVSATEQIKTRIYEVNKATAEQERSTAFLLQNISPIKDSMEATRRATEEHANSTRLISGNIETTNQKTIDITAASSQQQKLNEKVISAMDGVMKMGKEAVREVRSISPFVSSLREEVEALKKEIALFRITTAPRSDFPSDDTDESRAQA